MTFLLMIIPCKRRLLGSFEASSVYDSMGLWYSCDTTEPPNQSKVTNLFGTAKCLLNCQMALATGDRSLPGTQHRTLE